jgi:outer membrane protein insertion porin family
VVAVTDRYSERGYLFADVAPVTDLRRDERIVHVSMEITEGRQAFINRIEIVGNARTRDKVIRREIPLIEGDVFNSALLKRSRQNLEAVGFFEDVKMETRRGTAQDQVDVVVDLKEKPTGAFSIGGGFSSVDGLIALVSLSQNNLFGYGKRATVAVQYGQNASRFNLVYSDPHFLDSDYLMEVRGFKTVQTNYQSSQGFNSDTLGTVLSFGHLLFGQVYGLLSYTLENVQIKDLTPTAPFIIQQQAAVNNGESTISALSLALTRDTRDSFSEPTRGNRTRLGATYAGGYLGFDTNFNRYSIESSQYWPIWWKLVGNLRGTFWYGDSFGDTPNLPAQERFFLGGANTIRGFKNFTISPKDPTTGGETGGNKAYFVNAEVIFPVYDPLRLRGVVFFDAGNNLDETSSLSDLFTQKPRMAAGIGIRFNSPMGAIRLDWGFNLDPQPGERKQVLTFTAGSQF